MQKIAVFVCWCGSNIAGTVDVKAVAKAAATMPGVVFARDYQYMCSEVGQNLIKEAIEQHGANRIVVAACSPRMHETTFRKAAKLAGINPYLVEVANIREHCSWIHKDMPEGTAKAIVLTQAAVAKVTLNTPLISGESGVVKRALVIGGGIAGIQTALDIAEAGYKVDIVERSPSIGGKMAQLDKTFPTLDCSACILTPKMVDAATHENITVHTYSEIESFSGFVGNFKIKIRKKARSVSIDRCSGCGVCTEKCPSRNTPSEFEEGLSKRGAIYIPFAQAIPNVPVIDREACIKFKTGKCGICAKVCPADAVEFEQEDEILEIDYGAIVVATGFDTIKLDNFGEYPYANHPDIITSLEFERLTNAAGPTKGAFVKPSNKEKPKKVVFIQCVGSRDNTDRGKSYCSKICCMYTAKHAMLIRDKYPSIEAYVFYIDIRTAGKGFEEFQRRAVEEYGVQYIRGMVGKIKPTGDKLIVEGMDSLSGETVCIDADLVVLATATRSKDDAGALGQMLSVSTDTNDFFTEAHPKLKPVETHTAGIFLSGACQGPKDIPETVAQASAAAAKVLGLLSKDKLVNNPCIARVDEDFCSGCMACEKVCPYGAITSKTITHGKVSRTVANVNDAICQGCGACTVACFPSAMDLAGFTNRQILAEVDAICK